MPRRAFGRSAAGTTRPAHRPPARDWRVWASGRRLGLSLALWLAALLIVYFRGWPGMLGPWAPSNDEYAASLWTFVPFATGAMALWGILPRADWIDLQAVTHPHRRDTMAAAVVIAAFAGIQALVGWLYNLDDRLTWFIPEALIVFPVEIYLLGALQTAALLGASCGMVGLLGRTLGPIAGFACYLGLLLIQGYRLAPALIPRLGDDHSPWSYTGAALTVVLGLAAFRLTRSGTQPGSRR
ncbi:MAG: hypothetical protein QM804_01425 [Propionicimonas sp.]